MSLILDGTNGLSDVDGTAATPAIRGTDTNTGIFFPAADTIAFAEGGTEVARFDSAGNLGIGTASPSVRLALAGTAGTGDFANGTLLNLSGGAISATDTGVGISFTRTDSQLAYIQARRENSSNEAAYLAFATQNSAGSHPERMRIDSSGNLLFNSGYGSVATAYGCRAWVSFNGTGTVAIRGSGNVSSITDLGTGAYQVNITTALTDTNYAIIVGAGSPQVRDGSAYSPTSPVLTTSFQIRCWGSNAPDTNFDHAYVFAAVFR